MSQQKNKMWIIPAVTTLLMSFLLAMSLASDKIFVAAEGQDATVTLDLNGGFRITNNSTSSPAYSTDGFDFAVVKGEYELTTALIRDWFKDSNVSQYIYPLADESIRGTTPANGVPINADGTYLVASTKDMPNGLLFGLIDENDNIYRIGDKISIAEDMTLKCHYQNEILFRPGANRWNDTTIQKGWVTGSAASTRDYLLRDLQPLYAEVTTINTSAFYRAQDSNNVYYYVRNVEIPSTVTTLGGTAFRDQVLLASITGLENVTTFSSTAFLNAGKSAYTASDSGYLEFIFSKNLILTFNNGRGGLRTGSGNQRFIFTADAEQMRSDGAISEVYFSNIANGGSDAMFASQPGAKSYVYVPYGQTQYYYPTSSNTANFIESLFKVRNTNSLSTEIDFVRMREMHTVSFDLNGGNINGKTTLSDTYIDARAVSVMGSGGDSGTEEKNLDATKNPAAQDLTLLTPKKPADPVKTDVPNTRFVGWQDQFGNMWTDADWEANGKTEPGYAGEIVLTAQYVVDEICAVTIEKNNGEQSEVISAVVGAVIGANLVVEPTKAHYDFDRWYSDQALTAVFDILTDTAYEGLTLYAGYTGKVYQAMLYMNGGKFDDNTGNVEYLSFTYGQAQALGTPTRQGHQFVSWHTDEDFESQPVTQIPAGAVGDPMPKYYAQWLKEIVVCDITYELNGGTLGSGAPTEYTEGTPVTLVSPTKTGHAFDGWYLNAAFSGSALTAISSEQTGDVKLYAKWKLITHNVTLNYGEGKTTIIIKPYNESVTESDMSGITAPKGYKFDGFYLDSEYTRKYENAAITADTEIFIKWAAETTDGGNANDDETVPGCGSMAKTGLGSMAVLVCLLGGILLIKRRKTIKR